MAGYKKVFNPGGQLTDDTLATWGGVTSVDVDRVTRSGGLVPIKLISSGTDENGNGTKRYYCADGEQITKVKAVGNGLINAVITLHDMKGVEVVSAMSIEDADEVNGPFSKVLFLINDATHTHGVVWVKKGSS